MSEAESLSGRRIDDAGEKIGGARKDWARERMSVDDLASLTPEEAGEHVRKENIWPQPNYAEMIAEGVEPKAAALIKIIRDRLAAKPRTNIRQLRTQSARDPDKIFRDYVVMIGRVRDALMSCKTEQDVTAARHTILDGILDWGNKRHDVEMQHLILSVFKGNKEPFRLDYTDHSKARRMLEEGFPNSVPAWRRGILLRGSKDDSFFLVKGSRIIGDRFKSEDEAWEWLRRQAEAAKASGDKKPKTPTKAHLKDLQRAGLPDYRNGRDISPEDFISEFGFRGVEFGNWLPDSERQQVLNLAFDAFHDLAQVLGWHHKSLSLDGTLAIAFGARGKGSAAAHYEPGRKVVNVTRLSGAGSLAHEFAHAFDHWCGEVDRTDAGRGSVRSGSGWREHSQVDLSNLTEDEVLAWSSVKRAMFERRITKAESVAAAKSRIDEINADIAKVVSSRDRYLERVPEGKRDLEHLRTIDKWLHQTKNSRLVAAQKTVDSLSARPENADFGRTESNYLAEATKICGSSGEYWRRPTEMFARAFESMVFDRLQEQSACNDYLVHGVEERRFSSSLYKGNPYPVGEERKLINSEIVALMKLFGQRLAPAYEQVEYPQARHEDDSSPNYELSPGYEEQLEFPNMRF